MSCSVIPSAKYSCSGSPDRISSGRTAIGSNLAGGWPRRPMLEPAGHPPRSKSRQGRGRIAATHPHGCWHACGAHGLSRFGYPLQLAQTSLRIAIARQDSWRDSGARGRRRPAAPAAEARRPVAVRAREWRRGHWPRCPRRMPASRSASRRRPLRTRTDRCVRPPHGLRSVRAPCSGACPGWRHRASDARRRPSSWLEVRVPDGSTGGRRASASASRADRRLRPARNFARPKSSSFAPLAVSMILAGFKSRWTIPWRCAWSSALAISIAYVSARPTTGGRPPVARPACRLRGIP